MATADSKRALEVYQQCVADNIAVHGDTTICLGFAKSYDPNFKAPTDPNMPGSGAGSKPKFPIWLVVLLVLIVLVFIYFMFFR